jgi:hypothetical protein
MGFVYIRNKGGTGNQLFIYNFGLLLSSKFNLRLIIDNATGFLRDTYGRSSQLEKLLSETPNKANIFHHFSFVIVRKTPTWLLNFLNVRYITEKSSHDLIHLNAVNGRKPKYIYADGYFQSVSYLNENDFAIKKSICRIYHFNENYKKFQTQILNSDSVCIHVRRNAYDNLLSKNYYSNAVNHIKMHVSNPAFYIFSDSLDWCKENFKNDNVTFIDSSQATDDVQEFLLMLECNHYIIANSTFSWWAAILGDYGGKVVVAPLQNQLGVKESFYPKGWILV